MYVPKEIAKNYLETGKEKTSMSFGRILVLAIMAGFFIGFAAAAVNTAVGIIEDPGVSKLIGSFLFPAALAMILLAGGELFTGNTLILIPVLDKKVSVGRFARNLGIVYAGNFIGAVLIALMLFGGEQFAVFGNAVGGATINAAAAKVALPFGVAFLRGIGCNMLVCTSTWMGYSSKTAGGKLACLILPIALFVLLGLEHSIANMYFIPAGIIALNNPAYAAAATADTALLSWGGFIHNMIPVTLGNIIGGFIIGGSYWFAYLRNGKKV